MRRCVCPKATVDNVFYLPMTEPGIVEQTPNETNPGLTLLHESARRLLSDEPAHLLGELYTRLTEFGVDFYFHYINGSGGKLRLLAHAGISSEDTGLLETLTHGEVVCTVVAAERRPMILENVQSRRDSMTVLIRQLGICAYVVHPLLVRGELLGVLAFGAHRRLHFSEDDIAILTTLSHHVAVAQERQRHQRAVRDSEERLRFALEAGHMGTFEWHLASDSLMWDGACYRMFDRTPEVVANERQVWEALHPEDVAHLKGLFDEQIHVVGREAQRAEFRVMRPNGEVRWLAARSRLRRDEKGRPLQINGILFDITEHKRAQETLQQSEMRFRSAFEYAPIGMVLTDLRGRFLYVNRAYCSIVGYTPEDLLRSDIDFRHLTHPDDIGSNDEVLAKLVTGEIPAFFFEKRYIRKDGAVVWVRVSATAHRDAHGRPVQVLGLIEDITQRKRTEEALREADRQKDDFLAALGHELRNPLAPIRNAMQVLKMQGALGPQVHWAAEVTERQVQQMTRLVDDLLDVSRINRGKLALQQDAIDVADVVRRSVEATDPLIERSRHRLELHLPDDPIVVRGDPTRLTQAITNLLSNAVKFTPAGGVIEITLVADEQSVSIGIKDNGIGIATNDLQNIFEPFRQLHPGAGQDQAGLGLGLSLARRLIELHGGDIEATSDGPGKGSEFRVRLPRVDMPLPKLRRVTRKSDVPPEHLNVLVVDDNRDVAESLVALLQLLGHEAHAVFSGEAAIDAVENRHPQVVFCDIGLPDMSGHEVAAKLRRAGHSPLRLVALTGFARDSEKAIRAGFDEWFLKPIDFNELRSVLERSRRKITA